MPTSRIAAWVETRLINLAPMAAFVGAPLATRDPRNRLQQVTIDRYWHGAQLVAAVEHAAASTATRRESALTTAKATAFMKRG